MPQQRVQHNDSVITAWFRSRHARPTPAQASAWPRIEAGEHVLLSAPTGTGKTFAAFLGILDQLSRFHEQGALKPELSAVYVSPLRALGYDLEKNLNEPLREIYGDTPPIRVGLRTGDTPAAERRRQRDRPPHILLTTPESLCLLLNQEKWLPILRTVRWIIVDEIHALAGNKRGAHLSLSIERLDELVSRKAADAGRPGPLQRIGLSATVGSITEVGRFLAGTHRPCAIIDAAAGKRVDLRVYTPLRKDPYPPAGYSGSRLIRELARLVEANRTTLVFTNTRSGAEFAAFQLRQTLPSLADMIECHHASLDRDVRQDVEDRLKQGRLRAVVCSTSLELGIDIGSIDLVVMLATPKGVGRALQRTGRAGHRIDAVSRGLLMATNLDDLVECCATALLARRRDLDPIRFPRAPLDVLAQHLAGMGCTRRWSRAQALEWIRNAWLYRDLTARELDDVLDYLAGGGRSLRQQYTEVFGKIILDDEGFETRPGTVRRDLLMNVGVIQNDGAVQVRLKTRPLGTVEESFIRGMRVGDVFMIGGRAVRLERMGWMECFVSRADHAIPTVPRWNANKMPLSNRVASEIAAFRGELRTRLETADVAAGHPPGRVNPVDEPHPCSGRREEAQTHPTDEDQRLVTSAAAASKAGMRDAGIGETSQDLEIWIAERLDCGRVNAANILWMYRAQHSVSEIPTADFLLVESWQPGPEDTLPTAPQRRRAARPEPPAVRHYFFHSLIGRAANDALARVIALRLSRMKGGNAIATPNDYGFVLTVAPGQAFEAPDLPALFSPEHFDRDLTQSLARSELLQYHFRGAAQTGLMVYRNLAGSRKPVRKLQFSSEVIFNVLQEHEPDHVLLREARQETGNSFLDAVRALEFCHAASGLPTRLRRVPCVPPLSFALYATRIKEALLVEDPRETLERLYHLWWSRLHDETRAR